MGEGTETKSVDNAKDMFNLMVLIGSVLALFLFSKLLQNRQYWIRMEIALGVFHTLLLPFAGSVYSYFMNEKADDMTVYLMRLVLVSLVAQAAAVYFTQESLDPTVPIGVSISNVLVRGPLLLLEFSIARSNIQNKVYTYADGLGFLLLVVGDLYFLANSKTRSYSHRTVGNPISFHLSVDGLVGFFLGAMILGFPDMFLSLAAPTVAVKTIHLILLKGFGIMLLGGALLSFASLAYRDDDDAVATLKTRLVVYLTVGVLALTSILVDSSFRTLGHTGIMVGVMGGLAYNAGMMVYEHEKED